MFYQRWTSIILPFVSPLLSLGGLTLIPLASALSPFNTAAPQWLLTTGGSEPEEKRTIRVGRRRRSEPAGPEGRGRAAAPQLGGTLVTHHPVALCAPNTNT